MRLEDALPEFAVELLRLLVESDRPELAAQFDELRLCSRCACGDSFCSTFYVTGSRASSAPKEREDQRVRVSESLELESSAGIVILDIDRFDHIVCVEVLNRPDVEAELTSALDRMRHSS